MKTKISYQSDFLCYSKALSKEYTFEYTFWKSLATYIRFEKYKYTTYTNLKLQRKKTLIHIYDSLCGKCGHLFFS